MSKFQLTQIGSQLRSDLSRRKTSVKILELLLKILRSHFSDFDEDYKWVEDEDSSEIIIDISNIGDERLNTNRPAVFIKRGAQRITYPGFAKQKSINLIEAKKEYHAQIEGTYAIFVISSSLLEAEKLAIKMYDLMTGWSPLIETNFLFKEFYVSDIGEAGVIEGNKDKYLIPIIIPYVFDESWTIKRESVKLGDIEIETEAEDL